MSKGSQIRKGANRKAYRDNYDEIFRKPGKGNKKWQKLYTYSKVTMICKSFLSQIWRNKRFNVATMICKRFNVVNIKQ